MKNISSLVTLLLLCLFVGPGCNITSQTQPVYDPTLSGTAILQPVGTLTTEPPSQPENVAGENQVAAYIDPCTVITVEEVEGVLGSKFALSSLGNLCVIGEVVEGGQFPQQVLYLTVDSDPSGPNEDRVQRFVDNTPGTTILSQVDIGDKAVWVSNSFADTPILLFFKGKYLLYMADMRLSDSKFVLEPSQMEQLARLIVPHVP